VETLAAAAIYLVLVIYYRRSMGPPPPLAAPVVGEEDLGLAFGVVEGFLKLEFGHPASLLYWLWWRCAGQE
jgi:hypothetical protein